ncbi:MAG TPA: hybrid sensor histidine kinase/response regulator [Longimicrobiaceae bacterium]|nr:hybrid sensor histidine kinase/response regulator [Longimicrobiaceae bacterium]
MPPDRAMPRPIDILLVEDNPGDARLLQEYLRDARLDEPTLHRVETLAEAREHVKDRRPDVILLDLSLPDAHGIDTVAGALDAAPDVPIIVLTGLDDESVAVNAVQSGAQDYLVKGQVDGAVLGRSIRYAIERKQLAREREHLLSAEQEARRRAEAAVQARDQVLRVVSHDLGNHLAAIRINSMVLARTIGSAGDADANQERAEAIIQQVTVMDHLRQDLLDVASIEAGRLSISPDPVGPAEILESAADYSAPMAATKNVALKVASDAGLVEVHADRDRLLQALGNLVGNAIKFAPKGGEVMLGVAARDGEVIFSVADNGPGIAPDDADRIFESFWKSTAGNPGGAGLGLSIVKGIAEAHGGRVWFEPRPEGGSVFRLAVPEGAPG